MLRRSEPLRVSVAGLSATDVVAKRTEVVVTGVSRVDDSEHEYRFLDAVGEWTGGTTRDDQVPLGRLSSASVVPGMSGAPVRRSSDDVVVGVVSGRYNSADGWLRDSVWVARTEHLESLLGGVADVDVGGRLPLGGTVDLVLTVSDTEVRLVGGGVDVSAAHGGVRPGLAAAIGDVRRARSRVAGMRAAPSADTAVDEVSLRRIGARSRSCPARSRRLRRCCCAGWRPSMCRCCWGWPPESWHGCRGRCCRIRSRAGRWRCTRW